MFAAMEKLLDEARVLVKAGADVDVQEYVSTMNMTRSMYVCKCKSCYASLSSSRKMAGQPYFLQPEMQTWLYLNFCVSLVPI